MPGPGFVIPERRVFRIGKESSRLGLCRAASGQAIVGHQGPGSCPVGIARYGICDFDSLLVVLIAQYVTSKYDSGSEYNWDWLFLL